MLGLDPLELLLKLVLLGLALFLELVCVASGLVGARPEAKLLLLFLLVGYPHGLNLGLPVLQVIVMLHHELALVSHQAIDLLSYTLQLLLHSDLFLQ